MAEFDKPTKSYKNKPPAPKKAADLSNYVFDKLPPQARDLEEAVLGGMMLDKDAVAEVIDILKPESFYLEAHQHIYQAIHDLFSKSQPVDILTVTQQLRKMGKLDEVGGAYYVSQLPNRVGSTANIETHARLVSEKFILRELIKSSNTIIKDAYEETTDVFELLDKAEQNLFSITEQNLSRSYEKMESLVTKAIKQIESLKDHQEGVVGIPSGFVALDRVTSGWQKSDMIVMAARPGMGKCLGKGTKVVMYDGSLKKVEDVVAGDLLMGNDSSPRKVLSIARGREKMYWIRQNKGIDYRVNESHILSLKRSRSEGKHKNGDVLNITVKDYLSKSAKFKSNYKGYKVGVEFSEKSTSIEPYFLGMWLGDGRKSDISISTQDTEVVTYLENYAERLDLQLSSYLVEGKCPQYSITKGYQGGSTATQALSLQTALRRLNLLENKHIPDHYLANSTENRLQLLAGLIDSDGHYLVQSNGYEITQKSELLARQIKFLCDSLGFRTSFKKKKANSIGFECWVYRIRIYGDIDKVPVKVARKQASPWQRKVNWQVTGIQVELDKVDDYYGFELDGSRLFLLEDMTVTHNTAFVLTVARNASVDFKRPVAVFSLEMSSLQLVNRLISSETGISSQKLKRGDLEPHEWVQLTTKVDKLAEAPLFIDDTPAINIFELRAKCRRLKMQHDIQMIIIDYLQLMSGSSDKKGSNREQEISTISRSLKSIAKELDVPVIALSQLSRAVETRGGDKRPQLSDLRECVTGDTLIYLPDTGEYKKVENLIGQKGFNVLALNPDYQLEKAKCLDVWETGEKEVYEVETESGFTIKTSINHPFFTIHGWKKLEELEEGNHIGISRTIQSESSSNLSNEELIFLAHMIGDGCYVPRQAIHYTSQDEASREIVADCALKLWGIRSRVVQDANSENCYHVYLPSPHHLTHNVHHPFVELLHNLGLKKSRSFEKRLPEALFRCDKNQIALFIKHLWATDGCVYIRKGKGSSCLHYSSNSYLLVKQLKYLLLRFGIHGNIKKTQKANYKPQYVLYIQGKNNILLFAKSINVFGEKSEKLKELVSIIKDKIGVPNQDVIPKQLWREIKSIKKEKGFTERSFQAAIDNQYCGSSLYKRNLSRHRLEKVSGVLESNYLKNIANSDIKWEKIKSIKHLGKAQTYDLLIDGLHNFVANNFIIHNSGAIEQDADMVIFLYRPEYYGFDTDEEGNPVRGQADVIIAKHRNGPLDTIKLRFIGQHAKFVEYEALTDDMEGLTPLNDIITRESRMNGGEDDDDIVPF